MACTTLPDRNALRRCALVYLIFVAGAIALGLLGQLLRLELEAGGVWQSPALYWTCLWLLTLLQELIFRGILLPHRRESASRLQLTLAVIASLILYVLAHPTFAALFRPDKYPLWTHPTFLAICALLGLACSIAYRLSGSIWPPVLMHWLTIVVWKVFLGGTRWLTSQ